MQTVFEPDVDFLPRVKVAMEAAELSVHYFPSHSPLNVFDLF